MAKVLTGLDKLAGHHKWTLLVTLFLCQNVHTCVYVYYMLHLFEPYKQNAVLLYLVRTPLEVSYSLSVE